MTTVYVTAFKDIGRGNWDYYTASTDFYIHHFSELCKVCPRIVCFVEPDLMNLLKDKVPGTCMLLDYDASNTYLKYEHVERRIMNDPRYKNALQHRLQQPEYSKPTYNLVNHNKMIFIRRTAQLLPNFQFYAWVDFHYARHFDTSFGTLYPHLPIHQITIGSFKAKHEIGDPKTALQLAIESDNVIQGSTFVIPSGLVNIMYHEYEQQVLYNYRMGVADDDQNIHLAILYRRPELYNLIVSDDWGKFYCALSVNKNNRTGF